MATSTTIVTICIGLRLSCNMSILTNWNSKIRKGNTCRSRRTKEVLSRTLYTNIRDRGVILVLYRSWMNRIILHSTSWWNDLSYWSINSLALGHRCLPPHIRNRSSMTMDS